MFAQRGKTEESYMFYVYWLLQRTGSLFPEATRIFRQAMPLVIRVTVIASEDVFPQCTFLPFTVTFTEQTVARYSRHPSTVRSKPTHASNSLWIIRYASTITNICPHERSSIPKVIVLTVHQTQILFVLFPVGLDYITFVKIRFFL